MFTDNMRYSNHKFLYVQIGLTLRSNIEKNIRLCKKNWVNINTTK